MNDALWKEPVKAGRTQAEQSASVELLTVAEAAALLKCRDRFVYDLIESRDPAERIPSVRIGRRKVRILRSDLIAYIAARRSA